MLTPVTQATLRNHGRLAEELAVAAHTSCHGSNTQAVYPAAADPITIVTIATASPSTCTSVVAATTPDTLIEGSNDALSSLRSL